MADREWVVKKGEEGPLARVLSKMNADDRAIADGRVFIGRKRMHDASCSVAPGDVVRVSDAKAEAAGARILFRGDGFVAADKPAGIPTLADQGGAAHAFVAGVARALRVKPDVLHATSRLDRGVSGVVVFTTTDAAREAIRRAREEGRYERRYVAIASAAPSGASAGHGDGAGVWSAPIGRAKNPKLRAVNGRDATNAETRYRVVSTGERHALLALAPITGRTHQLRVHAAHAGAPLLGDRDYGARGAVTLASGEVTKLDRVALHCARVRLRFAAETVVVDSPVPEELRALLRKMGGADDEWEKAITCEV
jgi:23S rRNA-/tRNA-specific pseudouridylate synthase